MPVNKGYKQSKIHKKRKSKSLMGHLVSDKTKQKISDSNKGNKNCLGRKLSVETKKRIGEKNLKGDKASYSAFHLWLSNNFGRAKKCEHCKILSETFLSKKGKIPKKNPIHYALIHGKKHSHKRENYICLCVRCHRKYDYENLRRLSLDNR